MPKLSIITINYNNLEGLKRTLQSVVDQSFKDYEYIVIDGGSDDGSKDFLEKNSDSLTFWVSEPDRGVYNAMNKGIALAQGEYLIFLNSGDHFYGNNILKECCNEIHTSELIYFNLLVIADNCEFIKEYPSKLDVYYISKDSLPHPSTFISKRLITKIGGFDEELKIVADWKFFIISLIKFNATYKHVNTILTTFYLDGISSLQENKQQIKKEREKVLAEEFTFIKDVILETSYYKDIVTSFRQSKRMQLLKKIKLINDF